MLIASTVTVLGLPGGAPEGACMTFTPGHTNPPNMATGEVPFYVNISEITDYYEPDETYTSKWTLFHYFILCVIKFGLHMQLSYNANFNYVFNPLQLELHACS